MPSTLTRLSSVVGRARGLFLPLGLLALVAVGVHAAADVLDDQLRWVVDQLDAGLDGVLARWTLTAPAVNAFGAAERLLVSRGLALAWELVVDGLLALPLLGYQEEPVPGARPLRWRGLVRRLALQPTPMRVMRPLLTAVFALGGAAVVARLVRATLFVGLVPDVASTDVARVLSQVLGGAALALVLGSHGWRAVLAALEHADRACEGATTPAERLLMGSWGTALAIPLAVALVVEGRSLLRVLW